MDVDDLIKLGFTRVTPTVWIDELVHSGMPDMCLRCPCPGTWTWELGYYVHDAEYDTPLDALLDMAGFTIRFLVHVQSLQLAEFCEVDK